MSVDHGRPLFPGFLVPFPCWLQINRQRFGVDDVRDQVPGRLTCVFRLNEVHRGLRFAGGDLDDAIQPQNSCGHAVDGHILVIADVFDPPTIEQLDAANLQKREAANCSLGPYSNSRKR